MLKGKRQSYSCAYVLRLCGLQALERTEISTPMDSTGELLWTW